MGISLYGRKTIRRLERQLGERIVHASDQYLTTLDHRHYRWDGASWSAVTPRPDMPPCGVRLTSCSALFGNGGAGEFMRGSCDTCGCGTGEPHYSDCDRLSDILGWNSINPDYWPRPIWRSAKLRPHA